MKSLRVLPFFLLVLIGPAMNPVQYHAVKWVYDGDTILLQNGEKVRYLGINAPEIDHEGGKSEFMASSARDLNAGLVLGARIRLDYDQEKRDHYGRLLAYVFLEDGRMVNTLLLESGLSHVLMNTPNLKHKALFLSTQRSAIEKKVGIWSKTPETSEAVYFGNSRSFRFHRPDCPFRRTIRPQYEVRFTSRLSAFREGFSPCRRCEP
jgi:micrococcal nuclease